MRTRMSPKFCVRQTAAPLSPGCWEGATRDQSVVEKGNPVIFISRVCQKTSTPSGQDDGAMKSAEGYCPWQIRTLPAGETLGALGARHLYLLFVLSQRIQSGAGIFDAETYISTQPAQALEEARVPDSHEDEERGRSAIAPASQRAQTRISETGFPRVVFPTTGSIRYY
jgi:hypothetical protein